MIVQHIETEEMTTWKGVEGEVLIKWYLDQIEDQLDNEDDFHREMILTRKVLKKMIRVRLLLVTVNGRDLTLFF
jgi:DNA replication licensing factor MCM6